MKIVQFVGNGLAKSAATLFGVLQGALTVYSLETYIRHLKRNTIHILYKYIVYLKVSINFLARIDGI